MKNPGKNGPERRRNKLFVTLNTEYHVHDDRCVGVRDRLSGEWRDMHAALGGRLLGSFTKCNEGGLNPEQRPDRGHHLVFIRDRRDVVTSPVQSIERPPKAALRRYPTGLPGLPD
jgi:hypothetical protein